MTFHCKLWTLLTTHDAHLGVISQALSQDLFLAITYLATFLKQSEEWKKLLK